MTRTVNVHEAKTHLSELLRLVEAGEEVIIARAGKPVAQLIPPSLEGDRPHRVPGTAKGEFELTPEFYEPLPEEELAAWYDDPAQK
jgi:prevent-host-death family protein